MSWMLWSLDVVMVVSVVGVECWNVVRVVRNVVCFGYWRC